MRLLACVISVVVLSNLGPIPAARADGSIVKELRSLYPELTDAQFDKKLSNVSNAFHFMRTFVPYYYVLLSRQAPEALASSAVTRPSRDFAGWCAGDAHPENFGILIDSRGVPHFRINDPDDAGPCPLYADWLRFLVGVRLGAPDAWVPSILENYLAALSGEPRPFSSVVCKLEREALSSPQSALNPDMEDEALTQEEKAALQDALVALRGPGSQLIDGVKTRKKSGGSGGLLRYQAHARLARPYGESAIDLVEFKTIAEPGIFPLAVGVIPPDASRYATTFLQEDGAAYAGMYAVYPVLGEPMFVRPIFDGNLGVDLSQYDDRDTQSLLEDEATVLGLLHAGSSFDESRYDSAIREISAAAWKTAADDVAGQLRFAYEEALGK